MKVVLTGGAGFIGSHVAEGLLRRGAELHIVDSLHDFYSPQRKRANLAEIRRVGEFEFHEVDICDAGGLRKVFERARPERDALDHRQIPDMRCSLHIPHPLHLCINYRCLALEEGVCDYTW